MEKKEDLACLDRKRKTARALSSKSKKCTAKADTLFSAVIAASLSGDTKSIGPDVEAFKSKFTNLTSQEADEIYYDLKQILSQEDLATYQEYDSTASEMLLDDEVREKFIELSADFRVDQSDVNYIRPKVREKFLDPESAKIFKEIRAVFPKDVEIPLGVIGLDEDFEDLNNPAYIKGMKRLASLGYVPDWGDINGQYARIGENDAYFNLLKKMHELGGVPAESLFVGFVGKAKKADFEKPGKFPKYEAMAKRHDFDTDSGEYFIVSLYEFEEFLNSNENRFALKYSAGCPVGINEYEKLINDETGFWKKFFEDPSYQESLLLFKQNGFDFVQLLRLGKKIASEINDPVVQKICFTLSRTLAPQYIKENGVGVFIRDFKSYYDLDSKTGRDSFLADLTLVSQHAHTSWKESTDMMVELENAKKAKAQNAIANPISAAFDMRPEELLKDPAMHVVYQLGYEEKTPDFLNVLPENKRAEWTLRTARNLDASGLPVTVDNFKKVFKETMELRANPGFTEKALFANRNVAFFAHNELLNNGEVRFGKKLLADKIKGQHPHNLSTFRSSENTDTAFAQTKAAFLAYVATQKNLTVVIDAHGSQDGFYLSNGIPDKDGVISETNPNEVVSTQDMMGALKKRFHNGIKDVPIFIYSSCYSQDFNRNLNELVQAWNEMDHLDITMPIACGETEFGQYGFSKFESPYGARFFELLFEGRDPKKNTVKIKDVIQIEAGQDTFKMPSNISIFVPIFKKEIKDKKEFKKQLYYQIAQNTTDPAEELFAMQYAEQMLKGGFGPGVASYYEYVRPDKAQEIKDAIEQAGEASVS